MIDVDVEDTAVVLTTNPKAPFNIDVTVTYTPGTNPVRDKAGNAEAGFSRAVRSGIAS